MLLGSFVIAYLVSYHFYSFRFFGRFLSFQTYLFYHRLMHVLSVKLIFAYLVCLRRIGYLYMLYMLYTLYMLYMLYKLYIYIYIYMYTHIIHIMHVYSHI